MLCLYFVEQRTHHIYSEMMLTVNVPDEKIMIPIRRPDSSDAIDRRLTLSPKSRNRCINGGESTKPSDKRSSPVTSVNHLVMNLHTFLPELIFVKPSHKRKIWNKVLLVKKGEPDKTTTKRLYHWIWHTAISIRANPKRMFWSWILNILNSSNCRTNMEIKYSSASHRKPADIFFNKEVCNM